MGKRWIWFLLIFIVIPSVLSHEDSSIGNEEHTLDDGDGVLISNSLVYIGVASFISFIFVIISVYMKGNAADNVKKILFLGIIIPIIFVSAYLIISTVYLNLSSETKGPVHWHADFEIWNCNEKVDIVDPEGVSNRVGTSVFHEHGDDRIHVEGVLVNKEDAALNHFFEVTGGQLYRDSLVLKTNKGVLSIKNGQRCNNAEAELQLFVYRIVNPDGQEWKYEQIKVDDFTDYVLSPYSNVPPGDCIIVEFDTNKQKTDKICSTYSAAIKGGDIRGS